MKVPRLVTVAILTLLPVFAVAADVLPPTQLPDGGDRPLLTSLPRGRQNLGFRQFLRPV